MTFTCPKCKASIDLDLPEVTEDGTSASCPACKASFNVYRETFGGRVFRRSGEIKCADCGEDLGPQSNCLNCGKPFPDYLVVGLGRKKPARKRAKVQLKSNPLRSRKSVINLPSLAEAMDGTGTPKPVKAAVGKKRAVKDTVVLVAVIVMLVAVLGGGGAFFFKKRGETTYMKNYTMVAYGIQVGVDKSRKVCQRIADDWKTKMDAGQGYLPRPTTDEEKTLNTLAQKIVAVRAKLTEEPEKFKGDRDKLERLGTCFEKLRALALAPGTSYPAYTASLGKLDAEYKVAALQFRGSMQPEMMETLQVSAQKYRGLRPLLQ